LRLVKKEKFVLNATKFAVILVNTGAGGRYGILSEDMSMVTWPCAVPYALNPPHPEGITSRAVRETQHGVSFTPCTTYTALPLIWPSA